MMGLDRNVHHLPRAQVIRTFGINCGSSCIPLYRQAHTPPISTTTPPQLYWIYDNIHHKSKRMPSYMYPNIRLSSVGPFLVTFPFWLQSVNSTTWFLLKKSNFFMFQMFQITIFLAFHRGWYLSHFGSIGHHLKK